MKITVKIQSEEQTIGIQSIRLEHLNFSSLQTSDLDLVRFDLNKCVEQVIRKLAEGIL